MRSLIIEVNRSKYTLDIKGSRVKVYGYSDWEPFVSVTFKFDIEQRGKDNDWVINRVKPVIMRKIEEWAAAKNARLLEQRQAVKNGPYYLDWKGPGAYCGHVAQDGSLIVLKWADGEEGIPTVHIDHEPKGLWMRKHFRQVLSLPVEEWRDKFAG